MSKQATKSIQAQVVESSLAEESAAAVALLKPEITVTVTATLKVPHTYLDAVESNTRLVRTYMEDLALGLAGSVVSVEIK